MTSDFRYASLLRPYRAPLVGIAVCLSARTAYFAALPMSFRFLIDQAVPKQRCCETFRAMRPRAPSHRACCCRYPARHFSNRWPPRPDSAKSSNSRPQSGSDSMPQPRFRNPRGLLRHFVTHQSFVLHFANTADFPGKIGDPFPTHQVSWGANSVIRRASAVHTDCPEA
jgi:hypothetical protein